MFAWRRGVWVAHHGEFASPARFADRVEISGVRGEGEEFVVALVLAGHHLPQPGGIESERQRGGDERKQTKQVETRGRGDREERKSRGTGEGGGGERHGEGRKGQAKS